MNQQENREFREKFRKESIPKYYSPWAHIIFNFGSTICIVIYCLLQLQEFRLFQLAILIPAFLFANLVEYLLHRFPLHHPYPFLHRFTFAIHQEDHHHFYTDEFIVYDEGKDLVILFFAPALIFILGFGVLPFMFFTLPLFLSTDLTYLMMAGAVLYFIIYELIHYICHLPEEHWLIRIKPLRFLRTHHLIHHNLRLMTTTNFNIVFPFWDLIFGTFKHHNTN